MPQNYPLTIYRGDSYRWTFVLWDDAARTQPTDLTDVTVRADVRQTKGVTPLTCTIDANQIAIVLEAAASQALQVMAAAWDLQLTYPSGEVQTMMAGTVSITADVTQPILGVMA